MNDCEHYETLVSCWIDRELDREGQVEMLDHLARCSSCCDFYRKARELEGLVAGVRSEQHPPRRELWGGIEQASSTPLRSRVGARVWMAWAATIAVVAIGLGVAVWRGETASSSDRVVELRLGEDSGRMSEARFISLTAEMLRAEDRYRSAMRQILDKVERDSGSGERRGEEAYQLADSDETAPSTRRPRVPA